jgi:hypothetical protein
VYRHPHVATLPILTRRSAKTFKAARLCADKRIMPC